MVLFYRFVSVSYKLCIFLLAFWLYFSWNPRLLLLVRIKILRIPTTLYLWNIRRFSISMFWYFYLNFYQLMPLKKECALISYTPLTPNLSLESATNFLNLALFTLSSLQLRDLPLHLEGLSSIFSNFVFCTRSIVEFKMRREDILLTFQIKWLPLTTSQQFKYIPLHKIIITLPLYFRCNVIRSTDCWVSKLSISFMEILSKFRFASLLFWLIVFLFH